MFFLEGNIGAGKSTFLSILERWQPGLSVAREPLDRWDSSGSASLLTCFMQHPTRWGLTLETYTMLCRIQEAYRLQEIQSDTVIAERSVYSGYNVFARNSYEQGFLDSLEWAVCKDLFCRLVSNQLIYPQGFIYLQVSPETAFRRVKKRSRAAEATLALEYLEQLHQQHERFFITEEGRLPDGRSVPVLILPYDDDFDIASSQAEKIAQRVADFMVAYPQIVQDSVACAA